MLSEFTLWMRFMHKTNDDCFADLQNCEKKEKNKMDVWVPPGSFEKKKKKNLEKNGRSSTRWFFRLSHNGKREREKTIETACSIHDCWQQCTAISTRHGMMENIFFAKIFRLNRQYLNLNRSLNIDFSLFTNWICRRKYLFRTYNVNPVPSICNCSAIFAIATRCTPLRKCVSAETTAYTSER